MVIGAAGLGRTWQLCAPWPLKAFSAVIDPAQRAVGDGAPDRNGPRP